MLGQRKEIKATATKTLALLVLMTNFAMAQQGGQVVVNNNAPAVEQTNDAVLKSDPIDINGYVKEQPKATDAELEYLKQELQKQNNEVQINKEKEDKYEELAKTTEKLSDSTEDYLESKRESKSAIERYNEKIKCLMDESKDPKECDDRYRDAVKTQQAAVAPAPVVEAAPVAPTTNDGFGDKVKVTPYLGLTTFNVNNNYNIDTTNSYGVRVESALNSRWSFGMGISQLKTNSSTGFALTTYGPVYGEYEHKATSLEILSKFTFLRSGKFNMYARAGVAYNRSTQTVSNARSNSNPYAYNNNYIYGGNPGASIDSNYASGSLAIGSEVKMSPLWGITAEVGYMKGFADSKTDNVSPLPQPDYQWQAQQAAKQFANAITDADAISIFVGSSFEF